MRTEKFVSCYAKRDWPVVGPMQESIFTLMKVRPYWD